MRPVRRRRVVPRIALLTAGLFSGVGPGLQIAPAAARSAVSEGAPSVPAPMVLAIPLASIPARVDARLDEPFWRDALVIELGVEIDPGENLPAPVRTECLLAYDRDRLYVGFRAYDPDPGQIRAHLTDRDKCFRDDFVGVMLDTFNDERRGFEFFVNPLGVQMDLARNEVGSGDNEDSNWDALWDAAGRITGDGYVVEMAIPFSSLRFPAGAGEMTWGVVPFRAYPRTNRHQLAPMASDRNRSCFICQAPKVTGFAGAEPGRNLELTPTFTSSRTDRPTGPSGGSLEPGDLKADPGLSVRWGLTPNLAFNGTANPDFSQVEADVAQLDVNRRFSLFYPEKRPFFLEGSDFFQTPLRVVHTRSIADPDAGLKLTGKVGRNALGAFVVRDAVTNLLVPGSQGSRTATLAGGAWDAVARLRRDLGQGSTLGMLVTARDGEDGYQNLVGGADGLIRLNQVDSLRFQVLGTSSRYPRPRVGPGEAAESPGDDGDDRLLGYGAQAYYERDSRNWAWWGGYTDKSRDFRADLGFITQTDVRGPFLGLRRNLWPEPNRKTWFTRIGLGFEADHAEDQAGDLVTQYAHATLSWNGPYQATFESGVGPARERFAGRTYDQVTGWTWFNIRPTGDFTTSLETRFGDSVDYVNSRPGRVLNLTPGITYDPGIHLRLQLDHSFERLTAAGATVYTANLSQLRAIYQFDTRMFVRGIVQLDNLERNVDNYRVPVGARDRSWLTQLLFSYKLSPQTLFYVGYGDTRANGPERGVRPTERTFFLKLSYAWMP